MRDIAMRNETIRKKIENKKDAWNSFFKDNLKKVMDFRDYVYCTEDEKKEVTFQNDVKSSDPASINQLRTAINRIKTDLRDLAPSLVVSKKHESGDPTITLVLGALLNSKILTNSNKSVLYSVFDDILDMSTSVLKIDVSQKFNKNQGIIEKQILFEKISDLKNVFFDASVHIDKVNEQGKYVGYSKKIDNDDNQNKQDEITEFWEKVFVDIEYGYYYDISSDTFKAEKSEKNKKYSSVVILTELHHIKHIVIKNGNLELEEIWPYKTFPLMLATGICIDKLTTEESGMSKDRLNLVPFAEHAQGAQVMLDYAAGATKHDLKSTYGGTKFLVTPHSIKGHEDLWRNKSVADDLLLFNLFGDKGQTVRFDPIPVPPPAPSPAAREALSVFPNMLNQLLGVNLEQDISYNLSGEAIRRMQYVRSKNSKLYKDYFSKFIDELGTSILCYIGDVYNYPHSCYVDSFGIKKQISINQKNIKGSIIIKEVIEQFDMVLEMGRSYGANKEDIKQSLDQLYQVAEALGPTGAQIIASTLDIYASSLPMSGASEVARRIEQYVPFVTRELASGAITQEQIDQQKQQQAQQVQEMQKQQFNENLELEKQKLNADSQTAMAKQVDAQSKVKTAAIKANAEIIKSINQPKKEDS